MTATKEVGQAVVSIQQSVAGNIASVDNAASAVTEATELAGKSGDMDALQQVAIDNLMIDTDGTDNKSRLGANAILGVSMARRISPEHLLKRLRRGLRDVNALLETLPRDLTEILHRAREGRLDIHLVHQGLEGTVNRLVYGLISAALFLGSCLLLANRVPPLLYDISIFGALGCLGALVLGLRLLRAIRRSGELGGQ